MRVSTVLSSIPQVQWSITNVDPRTTEGPYRPSPVCGSTSTVGQYPADTKVMRIPYLRSALIRSALKCGSLVLVVVLGQSGFLWAQGNVFRGSGEDAIVGAGSAGGDGASFIRGCADGSASTASFLGQGKSRPFHHDCRIQRCRLFGDSLQFTGRRQGTEPDRACVWQLDAGLSGELRRRNCRRDRAELLLA